MTIEQCEDVGVVAMLRAAQVQDVVGIRSLSLAMLGFGLLDLGSEEGR